MNCNRTGCDQQARHRMCIELAIGRLGQEYDVYVCGDHALDLKRMRREADGQHREWSGSQLVPCDHMNDEVPF